MSAAAISSQCGLARSCQGNALDEDAQWRRLEAIGRVAERVWRSG